MSSPVGRWKRAEDKTVWLAELAWVVPDLVPLGPSYVEGVRVVGWTE